MTAMLGFDFVYGFGRLRGCLEYKEDSCSSKVITRADPERF